MIEALRMDLLKKEISVSDEEALKLAKKPKQTPISYVPKYKVDTIESKLNPLHLKAKPFDLPEPVKDVMVRLKQE